MCKALSFKHWWEFVVSGFSQAGNKLRQMVNELPSSSAVWIGKIKAPEISDNLFHNSSIPGSMKMWTSMQLKPVHPHGAVTSFIKNR